VFQVASTNCLNDYDDNALFDLEKLTVLQIWLFCKQIGVPHCGSKDKLRCQQSIAADVSYTQQLKAKNIQPTNLATKLSNTICRVINIVFSDVFIWDFRTANDCQKNRLQE
jgi:hypothetical protein